MRDRSPVRDILEYAAAVAVLKTLEAAPLPAAEAISQALLRLLDVALPRLRRTALRNLAMAMPEADEARRREIADGVFASLARVVVSFARMPRLDRGNIQEWISYEGLEHFQEALRGGRGALIATAHLGNWELSAFAHALLAAPLHVVVRPLDNRRLDRLIERYRTLSGNRIIEKQDYARGILKALAANQAVGILVDQNASLEQGVFADFFGIPAATSTGLARIAARSGAPVVPGFALWEGSRRRYALRFYPPIPISGDAAADTTRVQKQIEEVVRQYPDQWLWIHRRWKTRPPGESPLY